MMTEDERMLMKISKPVPLRKMRLAATWVSDRMQSIEVAVERFSLDMRVKFGLLEHVEMEEANKIRSGIVSTWGKEIKSPNILFNVQVNFIDWEEVKTDFYKRKDKVVRDYSETSRYIEYSAFPVDVRFCVNGKNFQYAHEDSVVFMLKEEYDDMFDVGAKFTSTVPYRFKLKDFRNLTMTRTVDNWFTSQEERREYERCLVLDFRDMFKKYIEKDFKFADFLERADNLPKV